MDEQIEKFFTATHCELWPGKAFYLTDPKERAKAVAWLKETILEIAAQ